MITATLVKAPENERCTAGDVGQQCGILCGGAMQQPQHTEQAERQ
jgi:hypothetical protein